MVDKLIISSSLIHVQKTCALTIKLFHNLSIFNTALFRWIVAQQWIAGNLQRLVVLFEIWKGYKVGFTDGCLLGRWLKFKN